MVLYLVFAECNVCPDCSVVERLSWSQIVSKWSLLHDRRVSLSEALEHLHLLLAEIQRLVHDNPGDCLPAAGVGGAALIGHIVPSVGEEAGQGELVDPGGVTPVLDLGQSGDQAVQTTAAPLPRAGRLSSDLDHDCHPHHSTWLLLCLTQVAVQLTIEPIQLDLSRPALVVDTVLAAGQPIPAPVDKQLLSLVLILQGPTTNVDTHCTLLQPASDRKSLNEQK